MPLLNLFKQNLRLAGKLDDVRLDLVEGGVLRRQAGQHVDAALVRGLVNIERAQELTLRWSRPALRIDLGANVLQQLGTRADASQGGPPASLRKRTCLREDVTVGLRLGGTHFRR